VTRTVARFSQSIINLLLQSSSPKMASYKRFKGVDDSERDVISSATTNEDSGSELYHVYLGTGVER